MSIELRFKDMWIRWRWRDMGWQGFVKHPILTWLGFQWGDVE